MLRQSQSLRQARDMGIDHDAAGDAKSGAQDHIRRLSPDARQMHQLLQFLRDVAAVLTHQFFATRMDVFGLIAKKPVL